MKRLEAIQHLKPFMDLVLKQHHYHSIPLLYDLAEPMKTRIGAKVEGKIQGKIERRYLRLCRITEELARLDFSKAKAGDSPEDFIFSTIDFSRYREINGPYFLKLFLEGYDDFSDGFFKNNFGLAKEELQPLISGSYKKTETTYKLLHENPLILSLMRTLETSMEESPLFTLEEIQSELKKLSALLGRKTIFPCGNIQSTDMLFQLLVFSLEGTSITHGDGMITELFISGTGELAGTFKPGGKAWTRVLIPGTSLHFHFSLLP